MQSAIEQLLLALPVLIFSVVLHEVAHGWVALRQGDDTAAMLGRLTLNPLPHIDPVGSLLVPTLLALLPGSLPILGWAKPVPVNPRKYRQFKKGDILVSLAGVAVNFVLGWIFALLLACVLWLAVTVPDLAPTWELLGRMFRWGVLLNFVLVFFNLIPIPPLDGSHVFYYLLPPRLAVRYRELGRFGLPLLFLLLWIGVLGLFFAPAYWFDRLALGLALALAP
jgi:Zn-dependent protease